MFKNTVFRLWSKYGKFIEQPKYIFSIYILVAVFSAIAKYRGGPLKYNNYLIFKNVFRNTLLQQNLYLEYPLFHSDKNHYGIIFSLLIAPFTLLPDWLGMILWNIANVGLFIYAVKQLPFSGKMKSFFAWLCFQELITAMVSFQFNVALTGLIILSACYIYQRKESQSAIAILIGTFVKIYGIVGLSSFFFIKNKKKFIVPLILGAIAFLGIPMLYSSVHFGLQSYTDWYVELVNKNIGNQVLGNMQDISLMGFVRRIVGDANISNLAFLAVGLPLFALPYLRIKQYKHRAFQLMILASTLLFTVLFSSGSESPTYIIAVAGVMIWFLIQKDKNKLIVGMMLFVLILTCFGMSDLFPRYVKQNYIIKYSLKALPCCIVWFRIIYELLTKDFDKNYQLN
ncbi:glycosyltransferase family 87 protein [Elizabethkingia meningoseptica]|uniref:glycosyltransferase family 87 protein n=1 Tax=Elizabethkingia meningoseptica TaxID=238 RepID=UPI003891278E